MARKEGGCEAVERWAEERGEKMRWGEVKRMQQGSSAIQKKNRLKYAYTIVCLYVALRNASKFPRKKAEVCCYFLIRK